MILIMGTKLDLAEMNETKRQVRLEEAKAMASLKHIMGAMETSSKDDTNITETFFDLATKLKEKHERLADTAEAEKSVKLSSFAVEEKGRTCAC